MKAIRININPGGEPTYLIPDEEKIAAVREDAVTPKKAADLLGTTLHDVAEFVQTGKLRKNPGGKIPVEDLEDLMNQGDEVELELREAGDAPPTPAKEKAPAAPAPTARPAASPAPTPSKQLVAANPDQDDAADDEDAPAVYEAACPCCDERLAFTGNVSRFVCPSCGERLAVQDQASDPRRNPPVGVAVAAGRAATAARAVATRARLLPLVR